MHRTPLSTGRSRPLPSRHRRRLSRYRRARARTLGPSRRERSLAGSAGNRLARQAGPRESTLSYVAMGKEHFSYRITKNGKIFVYWHGTNGKREIVLKGAPK